MSALAKEVPEGYTGFSYPSAPAALRPGRGMEARNPGGAAPAIREP